MLEEAVWLAASCLCIASLLYRKRTSKLRYHENPAVQTIGRLEAHASLAGFSTVDEARKLVMQVKTSRNVLDLGGVWSFQLCRSLQHAFDCREQSHFDGSSSSTIVVPGNWQLQHPGDMPMYTHSRYVVSVEQLESPCDNPTGYFSTAFDVPAEWSNRRVILHFGGVDSACFVWLNNEFMGFTKDSRMTAEFDITTTLRKFRRKDTHAAPALNRLDVVVCRLSDGYMFEGQDMWNMSGIFRDVLLISLPEPLHLYDFTWNIAMQRSAYSPTQEAHVDVHAKLLWNMEIVRSIIHANENSVDGVYDDGFAGDFSSFDYYQLKEDWSLSIAIYEEGRLLSSTHTPISRIFSFENSGSTIPVATADIPIDFPFSTADTHASGGGSAAAGASFAVADEEAEFEELELLPPRAPVATGEDPESSAHGAASVRDKGVRDAEVLEQERAANSGRTAASRAGSTYRSVNVHQRITIDNPKTWRPECPNIYTMVLTVRNAVTGEVLQAESCHLGLRTVAVQDGSLCVNNQPILIRGVNYHEFSPVDGHAASAELMEADIKIMKRHNINAIRTSHYPQVRTPFRYMQETMITGFYVGAVVLRVVQCVWVVCH